MNIGLKNGPVTAVMNGAGARGREIYGKYALKTPDRLKFIAIADPDVARRKLFQEEHDIEDHMAYDSWDKMMNESIGKIAEAAFICTQDQMHYEPAVRALELGYNVILEKPISPSIDECQKLERLAKEKGSIVQVCHVLRFTDFWLKIKEIVDSGKIGKIIHYDHSENVAYWHYGHSYTRGLYNKKSESSPTILAKTCHDLDLIHWIMGEKPLSVQSTGTLSFYKPESAPGDAPDRCTDGCPHEEICPWFAPRMYLTGEPLVRIALHAPSRFTRFGSKILLKHRNLIKFFALFYKKLSNVLNWEEFPATHLTSDLSVEGKMKAMREGRYGKCIYKCGNDVVDHQITTYSFQGGVTATLTMQGVSDFEGRELRIFGSKGTIRGIFRANYSTIDITDFRYSHTENVFESGLMVDGHGGGDFKLMDAFTAIMLGEKTPKEAGTTDIASAMESHYMAFAGEVARINGKTLNLKDFR